MSHLRTKHLIFSIVPLVFVFILLEFAVRLAGYGFRPASHESSESYFLVADKITAFRNRMNGYYVNTAIQGSPVATTDQYGYRNSYTCPNAAGTVVFVGDSTTFCAEVNDEETGPSEVAKLLSSRGIRVRVINAGVRLFNTLQSKRMLTEVLTRFPSTRLAVYTYCDNDFVENVNPIVSHPLWAPTAALQQETGELVEREVESPVTQWGHGLIPPPTRSPAKRAIQDGIGLSRSALLHFSASSIGALLDRTKRPVLTALPDGSIGPISGMTKKQLNQQEDRASELGGEKILEQLLRESRLACARRGAEFLVTRFAVEKSDKGDQWLSEICRRAQVRFVPISPRFTGDRRRYVAAMAGLPTYDGHYGPLGTRRFAEAIGPSVASAFTVKAP